MYFTNCAHLHPIGSLHRCAYSSLILYKTYLNSIPSIILSTTLYVHLFTMYSHFMMVCSGVTIVLCKCSDVNPVTQFLVIYSKSLKVIIFDTEQNNLFLKVPTALLRNPLLVYSLYNSFNKLQVCILPSVKMATLL